MDHYDSIIIGAGHNGLVCAAYLARQGHKLLVLEACDTIGGMAATREFHPGFKASVAHTIGHVPRKIADDLNLQAHGFEPSSKSLRTIGLRSNAEHVYLSEDSISGVSTKDEDSIRAYSQRMQRFAEALNPLWLKTMPRIGNNSLAELTTFAHAGINLRRLGKDNMREFLRIAALPMRDLVDENFDDELLKALMCWDALIGSRLAPRSPNSAVLALLYRMSGSLVVPGNSVGELIEALHSSVREFGGEVRTSAGVARICTQAGSDGLRAHGVQLLDGSTVEADRIVSAADPRTTFLKLVGVENLEIEFTNRIKRLRCDGFVAKLHLALNGVPQFDGLEKPEGRLIIAPEMDAIEFAFDDAKYGECSQQPVLEMVVPSIYDTNLAPDGQHVLSAHIMYVPYSLKGGWNEQAREQLCERVIDVIARYSPNIREQIIHRELLTPQDLERTCNVTGGHWHHTEFAMDQLLMMRPTYEAAQYSTPIEQLYLCSAGCHPGGGLMGGPGHNAAREILR